MRIACAECGCVVEHQTRVSPCSDGDCCCQHLAPAVERDQEQTGSRPAWSTPRQAFGIVFHRRHLRTTIPIALTVGTVLFTINHLDVVIDGEATTLTWVKSVITYAVPFVVANLGILSATRAPEPPGSAG